MRRDLYVYYSSHSVVTTHSPYLISQSLQRLHKCVRKALICSGALVISHSLQAPSLLWECISGTGGRPPCCTATITRKDTMIQIPACIHETRMRVCTSVPVLSQVNISLAYNLLLPLERRSWTRSRILRLSSENICICPQRNEWTICCPSVFVGRLCLFWGFSLFRFPCGFQLRACQTTVDGWFFFSKSSS